MNEYDNIKNNIYMTKFEDKHFMFDVSTCTSFELSKRVYEIISYLTSYDIKDKEVLSRYSDIEINEVKNKLDELINNKFFSQNINIDMEKVKRFNESLGGIELNISQVCNMMCRYCYADCGGYGGEEKIMDIQTSKAAIDFLIKNSGNKKRLSISFFGGEPLMNFNVIKESVQYAVEQSKKHNKEITFNMTTNGTLLTEDIIEFINKYNFSLVLSIDGDKDDQDYLRPLANNKSSYDAIIPKLGIYYAKRKKLSCRATITRKNNNIIKNVNTFKTLKLTSCYMFPVQSEDKEFELTSEDYESMKNEYTEWTKELLRKIHDEGITDLKKDIFLKFLYDAVLKLYHGKKDIYACGSGKSMVCVDPDGRIFLCHRFSNNERYELGNIFEGLNIDKKMEFSKVYINEDEECSKCWIKYFCGGGCLHQRLDTKLNELTYRKHDDFYCDFLRHIYKLSIVLYNDIMGNEKTKRLIERI